MFLDMPRGGTHDHTHNHRAACGQAGAGAAAPHLLGAPRHRAYVGRQARLHHVRDQRGRQRPPRQQAQLVAQHRRELQAVLHGRVRLHNPAP